MTVKNIFYIIIYAVITAISFSTALIFTPFEYVDNDHSYISCFNDGKRYETSPNYIFALDIKLDSFNDIKARKLCEHQIIRDYINSYPTPQNINYQFLPAVVQDSSWFNVVFVFLLTFLTGSLTIEFLSKKFKLSLSPFGKGLFNILKAVFNS